MRKSVTLLMVFLPMTIFICCKKSKNTAITNCSSNATTIRKLTNRPAVVKVTATIYGTYLVEEGAIDNKLLPCNLPIEFVQNDLQVVITGEVKQTSQLASAPCCAENFVIERIAR